MNLEEILKKYNFPTDKHLGHCYVEYFYEKEFLKYKNKNINFLEIGIHRGGSTALWNKYFDNTKISAVDIADVVDGPYRNLPNVEYYFGDAYYSEDFFREEKFDIIIDDGPHTFESQVVFINKYLPKMKKDGLLIIEDVQDIRWCSTFKELTKTFICETIDLRPHRNIRDDIMFVVRT